MDLFCIKHLHYAGILLLTVQRDNPWGHKMHGSMSDFDCNYALEILMRRLINELVMHVDLTTAKSPPNLSATKSLPFIFLIHWCRCKLSSFILFKMWLLLLEVCLCCSGLVFAAQSLLFRFFCWNAVWSEGLDKLTSRGSFQLKLFCDSTSSVHQDPLFNTTYLLQNLLCQLEPIEPQQGGINRLLI